MLLRTVLAGLAVTAALGLAACGGDDDDAGTPAASAAASVTQPAAATATAPAQASPTAAGAAVKVTQNAKFGAILTTADGLTLYTFAQDANGKSACTGSCAATWPPLTTTAANAPAVDGATGQFALLSRDDGTKQLAFNGKPLYRYGPDKPGDTSGDGIGGVWFVAKATATAPGTPAASTPDPGYSQ
jgi:predicted lipoprotein with Yx(FWY)xxD motif